MDRLLKDIVSEKATSYVSLVNRSIDNAYTCVADLPESSSSGDGQKLVDSGIDADVETQETAFSLATFIPLLSERLYVLNPYTRTFLVSWITVLNSIPDLDLIIFLPDFLDGLIKFLSDTHQDVRIATSRLLDCFLEEIKSTSQSASDMNWPYSTATQDDVDLSRTNPINPASLHHGVDHASQEVQPAFDRFVDFSRIIGILQTHLSSPDEAIQLTALRWISDFFVICPSNLLTFTPKLLQVVLPTISHESTTLRRAAREVNNKLLDLIRIVIDGEATNNKQGTFSVDLEELDFVNSAIIQL